MSGVPLAHHTAEKRAGRPLDKRRTYYAWDGEVCVRQTITRPCTGCSCAGDYPCTCCRERGAGCSECGHTGKVRTSYPVPIAWLDDEQPLPAPPSAGETR